MLIYRKNLFVTLVRLGNLQTVLVLTIHAKVVQLGTIKMKEVFSTVSNVQQENMSMNKVLQNVFNVLSTIFKILLAKIFAKVVRLVMQT